MLGRYAPGIRRADGPGQVTGDVRQKNMSSARSARFESVAHFAVVSLLTVSLTSNVIFFLCGSRFGFSPVFAVFILLSVASWLLLALTTVILNIAGSIHRRFSLHAMLAALLGIIFSGFAVPAVT